MVYRAACCQRLEGAVATFAPILISLPLGSSVTNHGGVNPAVTSFIVYRSLFHSHAERRAVVGNGKGALSRRRAAGQPCNNPRAADHTWRRWGQTCRTKT